MSTGSNSRKRKSIALIYNWVERKIGQAFDKRTPNYNTKTVVKVIYADGGLNETIASSRPADVLYALAAFLEDYLPKPTLKAKYKKYGYVSQ